MARRGGGDSVTEEATGYGDARRRLLQKRRTGTLGHAKGWLIGDRGSPDSKAVAKMASHAIFQYNVLVIDIDNTTLGLI